MADEVVLSDEERDFLEAQVRRQKATLSLTDRFRIIPLCAEGLQSKEVGARLGLHEHTVDKWRMRFVKNRIEGLANEYRKGRPRTVSDDQVAEVINRTLNTPPKDATHWLIRSMGLCCAILVEAARFPFPGDLQRMRIVSGVPSEVKRFMTEQVNATGSRKPAKDADLNLCILSVEVSGHDALAQKLDASHPIVGKTVHWTVF